MSRFNIKDALSKANREVNHTARTEPTQPEILAIDLPENFNEFLNGLVEKISDKFLQNLCSDLKIDFLTIETDVMLREKIKTAYNTGNNRRKREIKNLLTNTNMEGMR